MKRDLWSRILVITGLLGTLLGAVDPLEGSLIILPGIGLVALGALLAPCRYRKLIYLSFALVALGVGALFGLSAVGGLGGNTGRSNWWALLILPYPVGWILGLVGAVLRLVESFKRPAQPRQA